MKVTLIAASLAALATASPVLVERQTIGTTANEFLNGACRDVIFLYARGTNQAGNMGEQPGPQTGNALKTALGASTVAVQGVAYSASLLGNLQSGGCPASEATSFATLITQATTKCPNAKIIVAGYSQGAAMVHRAVSKLSTATAARVAAAVTYGDTQKKQDGGRIPNFPTAKTLILCNTGDKVCEGTLEITSAHLDYTGSVSRAVSFFKTQLGL